MKETRTELHSSGAGPLDPPSRDAPTFRPIRELKAAGTTILLVEQNAHQAQRIADRAYVKETGTTVKAGKGDELLGDPAIRASHLGE